MNTIIKTEEEEVDNNVVPLFNKPKAIGDEPPSSNWLRDIPEGWGFTCRERPSNQNLIRPFTCSLLIVIQHFEVTTMLFEPVTQKVRFMVHTHDFSRRHERLEVRPVTVADDAEEYAEAVEAAEQGAQQQETQEPSDGPDNRKD